MAPASVDQDQLHVVVAHDKSRADLVVPARVEEELLTADLCERLLRHSGVAVTEQVRQNIKTFIEQRSGDDPARVVTLAKGRQVRHGENGRVEWLAVEPASQDTDEARRSHYERSAFIMVNAGDLIARVHPPTFGRAGCDVTGKSVPARPGKNAHFKVDESIWLTPEADAIALQEGVLMRTSNSASIRQTIRVDGYVDFSTGNIDFTGDIFVAKGVKDRFVVKARGNVEVHGLIEDATIDAGGDLLAHGGFAGRERGNASIGHDLVAKYLNNVHGEVGHDLRVDREAVNCHITVHGGIDANQALIVGGEFVVTDAVHVGAIGSAGGVPTTLTLGTVPRYEPFADSLRSLVNEYTRHRDAITKKRDELLAVTGKHKPAAADQQNLRRREREIEAIEMSLSRARGALEILDAKISRLRTVSVRVERRMFSATRLIFGDRQYRLNREVRGPVTIELGPDDQLMYRAGDGELMPYALLCDVIPCSK